MPSARTRPARPRSSRTATIAMCSFASSLPPSRTRESGPMRLAATPWRRGGSAESGWTRGRARCPCVHDSRGSEIKLVVESKAAPSIPPSRWQAQRKDSAAYAVREKVLRQRKRLAYRPSRAALQFAGPGRRRDTRQAIHAIANIDKPNTSSAPRPSRLKASSARVNRPDAPSEIATTLAGAWSTPCSSGGVGA
ncbi:hypothetical protein [Lysobacter gummosus]|uniref:hypothetical protein n=1 Tax=Lysobacter gummosus TaxID=262324 RepID=UPI00363AF7FF